MPLNEKPPRRIRLTVSYEGTEFCGWQVQPGLTTIQGELERVLSGIEEAPVSVQGSGRTDAGVHALAQVAAVTMRNPIPCDNLRRAINRLLPYTIRVIDVAEVESTFHPRFDAKRKLYEYRIWREEVCPPFERRYVHHHPYPLDEGALIAAAELFAGEHDFSCFASADEKDALGHSKVRTMYRSVCIREGPKLIYQVEGSGFLKHMVRNLMGTLLEVGKGNLHAEWVRHLLRAPAGVKSGAMAPASGLFLVRVQYAETGG